MEQGKEPYHARGRALLRKYQDGTATPEERAVVESWYSDHAEGLPFQTGHDERGAHDRVWAGLERHIGRRRNVFSRFRWLPYAAAILLAATAATWVFYGDQRNPESETVNLTSEDIVPGGNRAVLTLADGRIVDLSEAQEGIVVGDAISYTDGSKVVDVGKESLTSHVSHLMSLSTPKGGTYQITLPDGSKVWLNAGSTLKYPSRFDKDQRVVTLEGEAFFEIQEIQGTRVSRVPFKVLTSGQTVEVLGTSFNLSAYADEEETKTTLVSGRVQVAISPLEGGRGVTEVLKPGEQSITRASLPGQGAATTVNKVDVNKYTSWKNGYFDFTDMTLQEVMRQLGRWYDLEVSYEGQIPHLEFYGSIERDNRLSTVMALLESNELAYRLEGRKLIVWHRKGGKP